MTAAVRAIDPEETRVLDVSPFFALFDATYNVPGSWVTLFEKHSPGVEYALRLWCSTKRDLKLEVNTTIDELSAPFQVVHVRKGVEVIISVHREEVAL